jgi:hypothetical protein
MPPAEPSLRVVGAPLQEVAEEGVPNQSVVEEENFPLHQKQEEHLEQPVALQVVVVAKSWYCTKAEEDPFP